MSSIEEYKSWLQNNKKINIRFSINRVGTLMHIDDDLTIILNKQLGERTAEEYIGKAMSVVVESVDEEKKVVYVKRADTLNNRIEEAVVEGQGYKCTGTVVQVNDFFAYINIENSGIMGIIMASAWRRNAYVRSLTTKCKPGDVIDVCVVDRNIQEYGVKARWKLSRESVTTDPWDLLNDDIWVVDTTIELKCVEMPKGKSFWWGQCDEIEDIEITCNYSDRINISLNGRYRCKIREIKKNQRIFRADPIAESLSAKAKEDETKEYDKYEKNDEQEIRIICQRIIQEVKEAKKIENNKSTVKEIIDKNGLSSNSEAKYIFLLIDELLKNNLPEAAYEVYKIYRIHINDNSDNMASYIVKIVKQLIKNNNKELIDTIYSELLVYIRMKGININSPAYYEIIEYAVKYYEKEARYADAIKLLTIRMSKMSQEDEEYNIEASRLYLCRGLLNKGKGYYGPAKSDFYFCLKYSNKIKRKKGYKNYKAQAVAEMANCDELLNEKKNNLGTDINKVDKYYEKLDYSGAYKYVLDLYKNNASDPEVSDLYQKTKEVYERSQNRMGTIPSEERMGKNFKCAYAAETIECNYERAEELYRKSIEKGEPGKLNAILSYIGILSREEKYYEALEACEKYRSYFTDIVDIYSFRTRVIDIYRKIGAYEEAVDEGLKIEEDYASNKEFIERAGLKRLASFLQNISYILSKELGKYVEANLCLDRALKYGLSRKVYAPAYINNCIILGQYERVNSILYEFEAELSDEFVSSIKMSLSEEPDMSSDEVGLLDNHVLQTDEVFYEYYISNQISECPDSVKTFFNAEEQNNTDSIREYISSYDNYASNLQVKVYLNVLSAEYVLNILDGYASKDYYCFLAEALCNDIEIRNKTNRNNLILYKYAVLALREAGQYQNHIKLFREALEGITEEKNETIRKKYVSIFFSNNPVLKELRKDFYSNISDEIVKLTNKTTLSEAKEFIDEILHQYTEEQNKLIEKKNLLLNYLDVDRRKVDSILVDFLGNTTYLLTEDESYINKLIDINRTILDASKFYDYLGIDSVLNSTINLVDNCRKTMEEDVTPLCLLMWFEILDKYKEIALDEKEKINVTLNSKLEIGLDNTPLYSVNGKVSLSYVIRNVENCAPAREVKISFKDMDGNLLTVENTVIEKIMGGESKSMTQMISANSTFSLIMEVMYKDNIGVEKKLEFTNSIVVNQERDFVKIHNPFTTNNFDPNDPNCIFVGRDELIENLKTRLLDGSIRCAVLYGQKRVGKSSIFNRLAKEVSRDFVAINVSMGTVNNMERFFRAVFNSLKRVEEDETKKQELEKLTVPRDNFEFEDYLGSVKKIYKCGRVLLLLDEFSNLYDLSDTDFPEQFMNCWKEMLEYKLFSAIITGKETLNDLIRKYPNQFAVQYKVPVEYIDYKYFHDLIDKPLYDDKGNSRFEENSFELFWQLTKGHPFLSQRLGNSLVEYLNSNKMEKVYDATMLKVVGEFIRLSDEDDFDSFYNRYSVNAGKYKDEADATLRLLVRIAKECSYNGNYNCDISRVSMSREEESIKADLLRRGVLRIEENRCEIYVRLFYEWLCQKGKNICSLQETYSDVIEERDEISHIKVEKPSVVNNYHYTIGGDVNQISTDNYIHNQVNNIEISIDKAVMGLERLQGMILDGKPGISAVDVKNELQQLPFGSEEWKKLGDEEREEKTNEYADKIFNSSSFANRELTDEQKASFNLSDDTLNNLSADCRSQIVCGIQVYDLIQYCIDNYGLELAGSESPRAILFARAFEKHMKDCMYSLFGKVDEFNKQTLRLGNRNESISNYPIDKTTIGTYTTLMKSNKSCQILAEMCKNDLGKEYFDLNWWKKLVESLQKIGNLRNECCHSGSKFDFNHLREMIELIFVNESINAVHVAKELELSIDSAKQVRVDNKTEDKGCSEKDTPPNQLMVYEIPDESIIGSSVSFVPKQRGNNSNIKGIVNGKYRGSLPRTYASQFELPEVKDKPMKAKVEKIQDGVCVLGL